MQVCLPEMQKSFYHAVIRSCLVNWYQQATLVHQNDLGELGLITQCVTCTTETISLEKKKKRLHCCLRCVHMLQFVWVLTASSGLIEWKACSPFADVFLSIYHLLKLVQPKHLQAAAVQRQHTRLKETSACGQIKSQTFFFKHKNELAQFKIPIELRWVESRSQWADLSDISWWFYWLPSSHPEYQTANAVTNWLRCFIAE